MATGLKRVNSKHNLAIREVGKMDRKALTDAIQEFVEYVDNDGEGSSRPDLAYSNITRQIYAPFGLNREIREQRLNGECGRDLFTDGQLTFVQAAERMAAAVLINGMRSEHSRSEIKAELKENVKDLAHLFKGAFEELKS